MLRSSRFMLVTRGWLRTFRGSRRFLLLLLLCSPVLIPFLFFTFPILCLAELLLRLCGVQRWKRIEEEAARADDARLLACEEGCLCDGDEGDREVGLLQRYLEDQLRLVSAVYECGEEDEDDGGVGFTYTNHQSPLLA